MTRAEVRHNKDCAMYVGQVGRHCSGWTYETCEGCKQAKLKKDGWYRVPNNPDLGDKMFIKRRGEA